LPKLGVLGTLVPCKQSQRECLLFNEDPVLVAMIEPAKSSRTSCRQHPCRSFEGLDCRRQCPLQPLCIGNVHCLKLEKDVQQTQCFGSVSFVFLEFKNELALTGDNSFAFCDVSPRERQVAFDQTLVHMPPYAAAKVKRYR
jgi:hypothetical protein